MYFKISIRKNPETDDYEGYYRLVESYRNVENRICHRTILHIGFIESQITSEQLNRVARLLTDRYHCKIRLFNDEAPVVVQWADKLWQRIVIENRLDLGTYEKTGRQIDADTIKHKNVREIGTEWLCFNTWQELGLDKALEDCGFSAKEIHLAQTQVISRAVYPGSELATSRWIQENSAITEITGFPLEKINKDTLYRGALKLYDVKDYLEKHLSRRTNELFDIQDRIIIYDLTNSYFEGAKRNSKLAQFGRSKEKRNDAKLILLALVINMYGFIKYSSIHEGNYSDSSDIAGLIDEVNKNTSAQKPLIVIDAGIATQDNLKAIANKGYYYLCVSRSTPKGVQYNDSKPNTILDTKTGGPVLLKPIITQEDGSFYVEVKSSGKELKESGMKNRFEQRFEQELQKIKSALHRKGGVKTIEKVNQRIGRAKQKYPSVHERYIIHQSYDAQNKHVADLRWEKDEAKQAAHLEELGRYYLRTNLSFNDGAVVWMAYNVIREVEATFRVLKTDLDLRPIYHKNDNSTLAHLHLGLLAYWLVNTIRCKLKAHEIKCNWKEIVRIGNTQKIITTIGYNKAGEEIRVRKCSEPAEKLRRLQQIIKAPVKPFRKTKSVVHKLESKNFQNSDNQVVMKI